MHVKQLTTVMDADLKKIKKLTAFMKKQGVLSLKLPDLELNLAPAAVFHKETNSLPQADESEANALPQFSEEEALFWSSPGIQPESAEGVS